MELTIPAYAKTISETLNSRQPRRASGGGSCAETSVRRRFARLFRRQEPTTYHRCLAVHMYFAQSASALD
jgi:hypothetical protein